MRLGARHHEAGVAHPEWAEDPALEHIAERRVFHACDEQPQEIGRVPVVERRAGLIDERQRREPSDPVVGRDLAVDVTSQRVGVRSGDRAGAWKVPYVMPERCVSRSAKVIGRSANVVSWSGPSSDRRTRIAENSGANRAMLSSSANLPSSSSMSAAVLVMGLVIDAMRNSVSRSIGSLAAISRQPMPAAWTT
jgi:hypothetical protein